MASLNDQMFAAQRELTAEIMTKVDRPNNFTKRPFIITKAKYRDGDRMFSAINVKPVQAQWFHYLLTGDERHRGDWGTGRWDILFYSDQPTNIGGFWKPSYVKRITERNKTEKMKRAALRGQRAAFRTGHRGEQLPDALKWINASGNRPGVFFGTVGGVKGYYNRPQRMTSRQHAAQVGAAGGNIPWVRPGSKPKLLLGFTNATKYHPIIDYSAAVDRAARTYLTQPNLDRHLADNRAWWIANRGP